ncbi:MAG: hypothetical protein ABIR70_23700 [Bryobacteraceae bacterium]
MRTTLFLASFLALTLPASAQTCDRECLRGMLTQYLNAMLTHDPKPLPLAANVRFTEDADEKKLGEGFWKTISGLGAFRQDILDVRQSTAGTHVLAMEDGKPVLMAVRLKIAAGKISEVESTVVRNQAEGMIFRPDAIKEASPAMILTPPAAQRDSREKMIELALRYPAGLKVGSFVKSDALFSPAAYRFENGQLMAGPGCSFIPGCDKIREQALPTLSGITARVAAVDEEQGIVWLRMNFGAGSVMRGEGHLSVWEMFKIYDGRIQAVEAIMEIAPAGKPFGWD